MVKVGGIECHALLDSGTSSCYASAKLLDLLGKQPTEKPKKPKKIEMEIFKTAVSLTSGDHSSLKSTKESSSTWKILDMNS